MHRKNNSSKFIILGTKNRLNLVCNEKMKKNVPKQKVHVASVYLRTVGLFVTAISVSQKKVWTPGPLLSKNLGFGPP